MRTILSLLLAAAAFWQSTGAAAITSGFPSAEVVSAKFNFKSFRLTIRWSNNFTAVARLIDQEEACKFSGRFVLDPASEVLVTGCTPEDDLTIQFHSKQFGNQLFTAGKDGRVVQYEPEDDMDYQHFTIESEYTPQVIPGSNGRVRRDADYDYDFVILSDDLALLPDLGEYEVEDEAVPTKVDLQLSFYLDPAFIKLHGSKADTIARQIVEQTRLLMKHSSLNTKIELIDGNRFYNSETHLAFSNQSVASKDIMITLKELLQSPFDIGKHPVAHVYITVPDGKFVKGVAIAGAMCHPKKSRQGRPRAIITWQKDVARTASTMAHEVGHLLGMYHDWNTRKDRTKNKCGVSGDGVFILNYGNPRTVWSSCSNDDFKTYYLKHMFQDEEFCLKTTGINSSAGCSTFQFQCHTGECIPISQRCDFTKRDCPGGEDEAQCGDFDDDFEECSSSEFQCGPGGKCIKSSWRCDGLRRHCPHGEDEIGCPFEF